MKDRVNKPRLFLSHSKKDTSFIERLCDDLRKCQIDPWLDAYEIRHGQSWLDSIFEDGMPICDAVLVYLSEHSIISPVVRKEIDAAIIQKLRDNQIAFLPYLSDSTLRQQLRVDLQAIHTPEWNDANYIELLPRVVAEVWHSYLERVIIQATQREKIGRLEAELKIQELEKQRAAGGFSASEAQDFEYIWNRFDRFEPVVYVHTKIESKSSSELARYTVDVHIGSLLPALSNSSNYTYSGRSIGDLLSYEVPKALPPKHADEKIYLFSAPEIGDELLMYGFLFRFLKNTPPNNTLKTFVTVNSDRYGLMYTDKLERFKYWMALKGKLEGVIKWRNQQATPPCSEPAAQVSQE
jgi:hypothetical protein